MTPAMGSAAGRLGNAAIAVGAVAGAFLVAHVRLTHTAWLPSYLCVWFFVLGLSLGSLALIAVHNLTGGAWGEVVRPWFEAAARMFPVSALMAVPLLFHLDRLYSWMHPGGIAQPAEVHGNGWYLNLPFFTGRAILYFSVWIILALLLRRWSSARKAGADAAEGSRLRAASAVGFIVLALTTTFAAIDWIMSLTPRWYSTIFGLLIGTGQVLSALAGAVIGAACLEQGRREEREDSFHDLGNLLLALVMLWAYLSFMQALIMWIEDLPDDISSYLPRTQTTWRDLAVFLAVVHLALPFLVLLSRRAKRTPGALATLCAAIFLACLADAFWLVLPTLRPDGFAVGWNDLFACVAIGGVWSGILLRTLRAPDADSGRSEAPAGVAHHA